MPAGPDDDASLSYIFLDVISCGLGGALLLGVILAVPKAQQKTAVSAAPYLVVRVEVKDREDKKPDYAALPNIWLRPPGATSGFDLPLEQFDLKTGRSRRGIEVHPTLAANGLDNTQLFLTGFFRHAEGVAELKEDANQPWVPLYELLIAEPPAGQWEFRVRYQNRKDMLDYLGAANGVPPITVRLIAFSANASAPLPDTGLKVEYGQLSEHNPAAKNDPNQSHGVTITVPVGKAKMPPSADPHLSKNRANGAPGAAQTAGRARERGRFSHRVAEWGRGGRLRPAGVVSRPSRWVWSWLGPTAVGRLLAALFQLVIWPVRTVVGVLRSPRAQSATALFTHGAIARWVHRNVHKSRAGRFVRRAVRGVDVWLDRLHTQMLRRSGYFSPDWYWSVSILVAAVAFGLIVYANRVCGTYVHVFEAYRVANVSGDLLSTDPAVEPWSPEQKWKDSIEADRTLPPKPAVQPKKTEDAARLFRALQLAKLQTDDDTFDGFMKAGNKAAVAVISEAMRYPRINPQQQNPRGDPIVGDDGISFTADPTARLIVHLIFSLEVEGAQSGPHNDPMYHDKLTALVCTVLADQPGASVRLRKEVDSYRQTRSQSTVLVGLDELLHALGPNLSWLDCFVFSSDDPPPMTNLELIALLYQLAGVDKVYGPIALRSDPPSAVGVDLTDRQARLRVMTKFLETLVERLRADPEVKHATKRIPLWKGYEQCAMWVVFFWTVLLLLYRELRRWRVKWKSNKVVSILERLSIRYPAMDLHRRQRAARQIHRHFQSVPLLDHRCFYIPSEMASRISRVCANYLLRSDLNESRSTEGFRAYCQEVRARESASRWFIRWLAFALPAIGFIGTKRGIAGALSQADTIVRAQDPGAQATAISTVTSVLGIAFTTTLIALVMGLITSFINSVQMHQESAIVEELEQTLLPLLEPERTRQAQPATPPPDEPPPDRPPWARSQAPQPTQADRDIVPLVLMQKQP